jgi:Flp pilus assembly protein TadD
MASSSPSLPPPTLVSGWLAGLGLVVGVFLAYAGSLGAPFVYDDRLAIPENPTIRQLWPLTAVLLPQAEGGLTVSGRPILNLSFAINYAISGTDVWSYHVFNLLVHAGAALLLFGIVRRTMELRNATAPAEIGAGSGPDLRPRFPDSIAVGFAVAALWALHPLHTQAVTYTVQRAESLMGFFYLLTLYAFVRGVARPDGSRQRRWFVVSIMGCLLGMGTKEVMATAPLVVLLFDRTFAAGTFARAWRERRGYYLALGATWLVLAALIASTGGNRGGTVGIGTGVPLWAYPLTQFQALARYLALAIWPHPLVFEYGTLWVKRAVDVVPYALVILPLLGAALITLLRRPMPGFFGACFFLILAPTSLAPGTIQMIVEHRMYLPLIAVIALVVVAAYGRLGRVTVTAALMISLGLGCLTYRRNHDYRSHLALWSDTVAKRPQNPRAHDGLAEALENLGRMDEALAERREVIRLQPDESTYHHNLALTLAATGQPEAAIQHYQEALRLAPNQARTHNNLAILLGERGDVSAALRHYGEAVRLRPNDPLYHYNHGVTQMRTHRFAEAAASFEAALRHRRDYPDAHFNLATALMRQGQAEPAFFHYAEALRLKPDDSEYRTTLGGALLIANRPADALAEFQRVLATRPDAVEARFGSGNALAALRRKEEAAVCYEEVLRQAPRHAAAHFKLGNVLLDLERAAAAVTHYTKALELSPHDAEAHHNLGVAHARLEQWNEARREFETALRLKPDYADARRNLEQLKALLGR